MTTYAIQFRGTSEKFRRTDVQEPRAHANNSCVSPELHGPQLDPTFPDFLSLKNVFLSYVLKKSMGLRPCLGGVTTARIMVTINVIKACAPLWVAFLGTHQIGNT
jgi:hypothetical protein